MLARVISTLSQFLADESGQNPPVGLNLPITLRRFHHHSMAWHSCGNAHIAHDHEPRQYFQAARKMGIVAARLASAWFHMLLLPNLAFVHLFIAVLSVATQPSGSRLVRLCGIKWSCKMPINARPNPNLLFQNQSKCQLDWRAIDSIKSMFQKWWKKLWHPVENSAPVAAVKGRF